MNFPKEEHAKIHKQLHQAFDKLLADFIRHNPDKLPSKTTILELMEWSYIQTINPTKIEENQHGTE